MYKFDFVSVRKDVKIPKIVKKLIDVDIFELFKEPFIAISGQNSNLKNLLGLFFVSS